MLAAKEAQARKDYGAAEREYQAVLTLAPRFAEAKMNLGLLYQLENRLPQAMEMLQQALKLKPDLAGANFFLGIDYCRLGEAAKAIPYLQAASREKPDEPGIWSWLATAEEMTGQIPTEIETLRQGLRFQPQNVDLLYLLGHAYERLGREQVVRMQKAAPGSSYVEQLLAESYASSSEWADAEVHLQNALTATPDRAGLHQQLGEVFLRSGNWKRAAEEFETEWRLHPHSLAGLIRRGEVKLIQGEVEDALADWSQAIAVDEPRAELILGIRETGFGDSALEQLPDSTREKLAALRERIQSEQAQTSHGAAFHFALAFLAAQAGDLAAAATESARAAPTVFAPNSCSENEVRHRLQEDRLADVARCGDQLLATGFPDDLRLRIAQALFEAGEYGGALRALSSLAASQSDSAEASYWRARCTKKLALAAYLKLYLADANSYRVHQLLGDLLAARGEDEKAMAEYREALAQKPALPNLHYNLGHLLWKNFKVAEARQELNAELTISPRHPGALEDLGATHLFEHQPAMALPYLRQALELDRDNSDLHHDLGTAYVQLADYARAEAELKLAVRADHDGSVHYKLGKVYQALGRKEEAAREFAVSTALNREAHRKAEQRAQRLGQADATPVQ